MKRNVQLDKIKITFIEEGIIRNYFTGEKTIEVEDIMALRQVNLEIANNLPYTVLVESEDLTSFSRETRELIASKGFVGLTLAKAIVFKSLAQRIIGNFYLHVNRPHIKSRMFNDPDKALIWLRNEIAEAKSRGVLFSKVE